MKLFADGSFIYMDTAEGARPLVEVQSGCDRSWVLNAMEHFRRLDDFERRVDALIFNEYPLEDEYDG